MSFNWYDLGEIDENIDVTNDLEKIDFGELNNNNNEKNELNFLSIDILSDTHKKHDEVNIEKLKGEVLIFSGDFMKKVGNKIIDQKKIDQMVSFNNWLGKLNHKLKIVVSGNHDEIDELPVEDIQKIMSNSAYLQNSSFELDVKKYFPSKLCSEENQKIVIYGSPATVYRENYWKPFAEKDIRSRWREIPITTNIIVTHIQPHMIMDLCACRPYNLSKEECIDCGKIHFGFRHTGCKHLRERIEELNRIKPRKLNLHVFGHSHDRYGMMRQKKTGMIFINSSCCNRKLEVVKHPINFKYHLSGQ